MDILTLIYVLGALLIGFLLGITTENVYKVNQVRIYQDRLHKSEKEKELLREQLDKYHENDTVEIINIPKADRSYHKPF